MISRFVQFKKLSQNDIKNLQKTVLKNDVKMMTKNIEKLTKNVAKIRKNDLQKSMRKLVRFLMQSPVTAEPYRGPGGTYNSTRYPPDRIYPGKK